MTKQVKKTDGAAAARVETFTFGDPIAILDRNEIFDYMECLSVGKYYEPPISFAGLAKAFRASVHHSSAIYVKRNMLVSCFVPHLMLSRSEFAKWALDYLVFGNAPLERKDSRLGKPMAMEHVLAKYTRRGTDLETYYYVTGYKQEHEFKSGSIFHLMEPDVNQELYGLPEYLPALHSALLNEDATLFRRRYYKNGSHAGFILYMTDAAQKQEDVDALRDALKRSKGPGNFRNLFMYAPNGKKDGIQLIPVSEVAAKDEFFNIKNITRDDQLAAHRVPPQLMGVIPTNTGGFGNPQDTAQVFYRNELKPLQARFMELNEWLGVEVVKFTEYTMEETTKPNA